MNFSLLESENTASQETVAPKQPLLNLLNDERGGTRLLPAGTIAMVVCSIGVGYILLYGNFPRFNQPPAFPKPTPELSLTESTRFKEARAYLERKLQEGKASEFNLDNNQWTIRLIPPVIEKIEVLDKDGISPTDFPTMGEASKKIGKGWDAGKTYLFRPEILITEQIGHSGIEHEWLMAHESDPSNQIARVYTFDPALGSIYGTSRARLLGKDGKEVSVLALKRDSNNMVDTIFGRDYAKPRMVITPTPVATITVGPAFDWTATPTPIK